MTLSLAFNLYSGEMTGAGSAALKVLESHQMSLSKLKSSGHKVILGEMTGAGRAVELDRIVYIVTTKELFNLDQADHVEFKFPSQAKAIKDVKHFEFGAKKIKIGKLAGVVFK